MQPCGLSANRRGAAFTVSCGRDYRVGLAVQVVALAELIGATTVIRAETWRVRADLGSP